MNFKAEADTYVERVRAEFEEAEAMYERAKHDLQRAETVAACEHKNLKEDNSSFALFETVCKDCGFSSMY